MSGTQPFADGKTVETRHHDVENDYGGQMPLDLFQRVIAILGFMNLESGTDQHQTQQRARHWFIVDN
jgi:hypothetical protein